MLAGLVRRLTKMPFKRSAFRTPYQFMSSYFSDRLHIALKLDRASDSISRSSVSFRLSASRIAPSSALELEAAFPSGHLSLRAIFLVHPSLYHTPIAAAAFSHPLRIAEPSVLIVANPPQLIKLFSLAGSLSLWNGSNLLDLCPAILPNTLIPPSKLCSVLVSALSGSVPPFLLILLGVCHRSCF